MVRQLLRKNKKTFNENEASFELGDDGRRLKFCLWVSYVENRRFHRFFFAGEDTFCSNGTYLFKVVVTGLSKILIMLVGNHRCLKVNIWCEI